MAPHDDAAAAWARGRVAASPDRDRYAVEYSAVPYTISDGVTLSLHTVRPLGAPPGAALLDIHGGAWTHFDHRVDFYWCRELARRGHVVASADFRLAPRYPWPLFLADLRAAARWLRAHAAALGADPRRVGAIGGSTGGHLAALLALWPDEPHHPQTIALDTPAATSAHLDFAVPLWPILDVPGRYALVTETRFGALTRHLARRLLARRGAAAPSAGAAAARMQRLDALRGRAPRRGEAAARLAQRLTALAGELPLTRAVLYDALARAHAGAFRDRAEMEDASPLHLLRRGDAQHLPPLLVVQGTRDTNMTVAMTEAFAQAYRARGGHIDVDLVPGMGHSYGNVPSRAADALIERVDRFIRELPAFSDRCAAARR